VIGGCSSTAGAASSTGRSRAARRPSWRGRISHQRRGRQPRDPGAARGMAGGLRRPRSGVHADPRRRRRHRAAGAPRRARVPLHHRREHRHATLAAADRRLSLASDPLSGGGRSMGRQRSAGTRVHDHRHVGFAGAGRRVQGETYRWRKRTEWRRFADLPATDGGGTRAGHGRDARAGRRGAGSAAHGWRVTDPLAVSMDPWRYRDYVCGSRGEFNGREGPQRAPPQRMVQRSRGVLPRGGSTRRRAGHGVR
jgi:hypothetical protein